MPGRFTFRFDTMLKIRKQREDEHKRIVADRIRQIAGLRHQRDSIERQIDEESDAIRGSQRAGRIDLQQSIRHRNWLSHLHKAKLETEAQIRFMEARLAQERAALAEAAKQWRILEKLKERQRQRWYSEQMRREIREEDEMATVRYVFDEVVADR